MELNSLPLMILLLLNTHSGVSQERPKVKVTVKPDVDVFRGESVSLTCDIQGGGDTIWQYSWYKDDSYNPVSKLQTYRINSVTESHTGKYTCEGTERGGTRYSYTSDAVTLTVSGSKPKPELTSSIKGVILTGHTVTLICDMNQSTGWMFYWYKNTQNSEKTTTETNSYTVQTVTVSDGGQYWCRAGRGTPVYYTDYSDALWVNVTVSFKPVVSVKPEKQLFIEETVTLRCDIQTEGNTEWTYSWDETNTYWSNWYPVSHCREQECKISLKYSGTYLYACRGQTRDSQTSEISDAVTLTVSGSKPKPELTSSINGVILTGHTVTLICHMNQSTGWKFYWYKNTQYYVKTTATNSYTVQTDTVSDGGQYWCRAGRGTPVYYTHYSDALRVRVTVSPKPVVSVKPEKQLFIGETVTLRCDIQTKGNTEWKYSWNTENKDHWNPVSHCTKQECEISSVTYSHSGKYTCRGQTTDSQTSEISDAVTLTVSGSKPELASFSDSFTVTLICQLDQSTGWMFYWYQNTQNSAKTTTATNSYTVQTDTVSDGVQYWCRAGRGTPVYYTHYSDALWVRVTGVSPAVSLIISPSRTQHFTSHSLSLSCEDQSKSTVWRVRRYTDSERLESCSLSQWTSETRSTCNISSLITSHTGVYWCQSESGEISHPVNITVHNGFVILESPVHPVTEGDTLTLHCLHRSTNPSNIRADFYKDESLLQNQTTGEMIITTVSKSHEGLYYCKDPERGESPKSWISVRVSGSQSHGLIIGVTVGLSVTFLLFVLLILLWSYKNNKGEGFQSPSTDNQNINQTSEQNWTGAAYTPLQPGADHIYESVYTTVKKDTGTASPPDLTYVEIELKSKEEPKKKKKEKQGKITESDDTVYSKLKMETDLDAVAGPSDVAYAEVTIKHNKVPKKFRS